MISRRSIPNSMSIYRNGVRITKDELVDESSKWSEKQIDLIKKIIKQGGHASIKGVRYNFSETLDSYDEPRESFIEIKVEEDEETTEE